MNKGDVQLPENYRTITILGCFDKLFTALLNDRLTSYLETNKLLNQIKLDSENNTPTIDTIFVLHVLSEYCKVRNQTILWFC